LGGPTAKQNVQAAQGATQHIDHRGR